MLDDLKPPAPPALASAATVEAAVRRWVERVVVGEGLCPFARPVLKSMRVAVSDATDLEQLFIDLSAELQRLLDTPAGVLPTTILALPRVLGDFEDYLDALDVAVTLLADAGLDGEIQIASFHPDYRFADAPADDPANATNRSPVPLFHLLREEDVAHAVDGHPDPDAIPERNQAHFRRLGVEGVRTLLARCAD